MAKRKSGFSRANFAWYLAIDGGIVALTALGFSQSAYDTATEVAPLPPQSTIKALAVGTAAIHVIEATFASRIAKRTGLDSRRWARQTLLLGLPSLRLLRRDAKRSAKVAI